MRRFLLAVLVPLSVCLSPALHAAPDDLQLVTAHVKETRERVQREIEAMRDAERSPENTYERTLLYDRWALSEMDLGDSAAALAVIEASKKEDVAPSMMHLTAGLVHLYAKNWQDAATHFEQADLSLTLWAQEVAKLPSAQWDRFLDDYLWNRHHWTVDHTLAALAQGQGERAVHWSGMTCNYIRLQLLKELSQEKGVSIPAERWLQIDAELHDSGKLPGRLAELPCLNPGPQTLYVLISRIRAGQAINGDAEDWPHDSDKPLYGRLIKLLTQGKPIRDAEMRTLARQANPDRLDYLDVLCEAHYFSGIYYRYLKKNEAEARRHFRLARETGSIFSMEYKLAQFELERS